MTTTVELAGLEIFGHHGVGEEERRGGQPLLFDLWLEVEEPASDRIEDAVDYREVAACVREVSDTHEFLLLEKLAAAVAEAIARRFPVHTVRVRVRKPQVELEEPVEYSAATAERSASR